MTNPLRESEALGQGQEGYASALRQGKGLAVFALKYAFWYNYGRRGDSRFDCGKQKRMPRSCHAWTRPTRKTRPTMEMQPRLDYRHIVAGTGGAMSSLDHLVRSSALASQEPLLLELVKIRASQINGCAY